MRIWVEGLTYLTTFNMALWSTESVAIRDVVSVCCFLGRGVAEWQPRFVEISDWYLFTEIGFIDRMKILIEGGLIPAFLLFESEIDLWLLD